MDRLDSMRILIAAVEAGSLSAASRQLKMPLATVSRKISELEAHLQTGALPLSGRKALMSDPYAYGVQANRAILETLTRYSVEQGLSRRQAALDEIFTPSSLNL